MLEYAFDLVNIIMAESPTPSQPLPTRQPADHTSRAPARSAVAVSGGGRSTPVNDVRYIDGVWGRMEPCEVGEWMALPAARRFTQTQTDPWVLLKFTPHEG